MVFNKETQQVGEPFHTLQIDPRAGTVDLIGPLMVLRHQLVRKP